MRKCTRVRTQIMAGDSRKQPELFRSNLFSSPSSGLSLGLGGDTFSSPLSLAPALASASTGGDAGIVPRMLAFTLCTKLRIRLVLRIDYIVSGTQTLRKS